MSGVTNGRFVDRAKNISYEVIIRKFFISIIILPGPSAQLLLLKKLQLAKVRTWPGGENAVLTVGTTLREKYSQFIARPGPTEVQFVPTHADRGFLPSHLPKGSTTTPSPELTRRPHMCFIELRVDVRGH